MIGHEYEGMNITSPAPGRALEEFQVGQSIFVIEEASLTIVTTLGDVLWDANQIESTRPGHDRIPA